MLLECREGEERDQEGSSWAGMSGARGVTEGAAAWGEATAWTPAGSHSSLSACYCCRILLQDSVWEDEKDTSTTGIMTKRLAHKQHMTGP